ncbi:MAG: hypothetical protein AAF747_11315, partial [Planctomycetota bacterium]
MHEARRRFFVQRSRNAGHRRLARAAGAACSQHALAPEQLEQRYLLFGFGPADSDFQEPNTTAVEVAVLDVGSWLTVSGTQQADGTGGFNLDEAKLEFPGLPAAFGFPTF